MAGNNKQSDVKSRPESRRHRQGISQLEAWFIGLGVVALIIGSALHTYFDKRQEKLDTLIQNSQAVGQWLQAAYLLSQSTGQTSFTMCDIGKTRSGKACITELISQSNVLLSLKNPYFMDSESASVFAVFDGGGRIPAAGRPCSHLAEQFTIFTSAGLYQGKPTFWRGTIILNFQEKNRQLSAVPHRLIVGYCDGGGQYQRLPTDIPFG